MERAIAEMTLFRRAIGVPESRKAFGERRNSYLKRAIADRTRFRRSAGCGPYAVFGETTLFSIGGCERNGMNFDEADPTRYLVKQHYFLFGGCERNGMNFDDAQGSRVCKPYFAFLVQTGDRRYKIASISF